jgi:hypothetical protein
VERGELVCGESPRHHDDQRCSAGSHHCVTLTSSPRVSIDTF